MRKNISHIIKMAFTFLNPLILVLLFELEVLYLGEKITLSIFLIIYTIPMLWQAENKLSKILSRLFFASTILILIAIVLLSCFNIFGDSIKARYLNISDASIYYVIEAGHFYEETTLNFKKKSFSETEIISSDFYMNGIRDITIQKNQNGHIYYKPKPIE